MSDEILDIPPLLKRLANDQVDSKGKKFKWVPAKFQEKYINTRPDGTKVYMYQEVEGSHRLYEDGTKVYSQDLIKIIRAYKNNPQLFIACTIIFVRKFDAYRLKLKEIKLLRIKKSLKTPYFNGFF